MFNKFITVTLISVAFLATSCASHPAVESSTNTKSSTNESLSMIQPLVTLYDYDVMNSQSHQPMSVSALAKELKDVDVVFMGEFHSHQAAHKLQLDLLQALYQQNPNLILSMEQFTRDAQPILDGYLSGKYGERTLIDEAKAWDHYKGSYRATVEFAREHHIPVIAANAPSMFVRCVGKKGVEVLATLPEEKKAWSARALDLDNEHYKAKFMSFMKGAGMSHGQSPEVAKKRMMNTYAAQLLRDTTMAESIAAAMKKYPERKVIHLNGSFHSDAHLGTVAVLETMLPELNVSVMSPVMVEDANKPVASENDYTQGDYIYLLKELPPRFLDEEKEAASIRKLIGDRMKKKCEL